MTAPPGVFVVGTDTGIGKTVVAVGLVRAGVAAGWRVAAMKPVASGARRTPDGLRNEDALALISASNVPTFYNEVNPYCFEPPVSPHLAARAAGATIEIDRLALAAQSLAARADWLVVEGAGGLLAPLDPPRTIADLAAALRLPLLLVVGLRLGCLNHAALTFEAARRRGLPVAGWVANRIDPAMARADDNLRALESLLDSRPLAVLDHDPQGLRHGSELATALQRLTASRAA